MAKNYCCKIMELAVEGWGGVWWDKEKKCWLIVDDYGDENIIRKIENCIWCGKELLDPHRGLELDKR